MKKKKPAKKRDKGVKLIHTPPVKIPVEVTVLSELPNIEGPPLQPETPVLGETEPLERRTFASSMMNDRRRPV